MASNSRFRTTSGPSSGRPFSADAKAFKKNKRQRRDSGESGDYVLKSKGKRNFSDRKSFNSNVNKSIAKSSANHTKPRKRKSFIESRLDKQRVARPVTEDKPTVTKDDLIRLNKFISNSGVCSRREADDLIAMSLITVNGKSV